MNALAKFRILRNATKPRFFGFFHGHSDLSQAELEEIGQLVDAEQNPEVEKAYESGLAALIGDVDVMSFAAGRMAFYAALRALEIGEGHEVLLTGFTCAVMPNAVWRTGATPRYADISPDTLGTDPSDVLRKISPRTKAIVVQHTFGVPCDVAQVARIAREHGITLIEDCALTIGSMLDGKPVGSWGDAAIFSTDHSKPLNTVIGGALAMRNQELAGKVRKLQSAAPPLSLEHRRRLWRRLLLEKKYLTTSSYGRGKLLASIHNAPRRLRERINGRDEPVLLEADFKPRLKPDAYPYPARLPAFLAKAGLCELDRWPRVAALRRSVLEQYLGDSPVELRKYFPKAYGDPKRQIIPLRLAYAHPAAAEIERRMSSELDIDFVWFKEPIVCATSGPASFGYQPGECPNAERIGRQIINWPCNVAESDVPPLLELFRKCHAGL